MNERASSTADLADAIDIRLDERNCNNPALLVSPLRRHLGPPTPDLADGPLHFRVGRRPVVCNLRALYEKTGKRVPPVVELFVSYELWLISHHVDVLDSGSWKTIKNLGFKVWCKESTDATVLNLFPQSQFVKRFGAEFKNEVEFGIDGSVTAVSPPTDFLTESDLLKDFVAGGRFKASSSVQVVGQWSFSVVTPIIQAIGIGDSRSEWLFTRQENQPLLGSHRMVQLLMVPKNRVSLNMFAQVCATINNWAIIPCRMSSEDIQLSCALK